MRLVVKTFDAQGERLRYPTGDGEDSDDQSTYDEVEDFEEYQVTDLRQSSLDGTVWGLVAEDIALAFAKGAHRVIILREELG